ncbi:T9SS type A sorting domain-containing protein [candidate division KSB1 bacterium]|nr:T9SS type A sorting domain-containing protein [candidate division KSB1 bacterium]
MRGKNGFPLAALFATVFFILYGTPMSEAQPLGRNNAFWQKYLTGGAGPVEYGANAACVDAQGNVFIAGNFDDDGLQSLRVAKWIGNQWQILGDRFPGGRAAALAVDNSGNVYVGGLFEYAVKDDGSEVVSQNIAKWNQSTGQWEALGGGVDDDVFALAIDNNSNVYVGGNLTRGFNPDGAQVTIWRIGKWNTQQSVWEPLGEGVVNTGSNPVTALAIAANNDVIVGGYFTGVYNPGRVAVTVNSIARWNGASWSALGQGLTGPAGAGVVSDIAIDNTGRIYVTGGITTATNDNGASVNGPLVYWDGGQWHSINIGAPAQAIGGLAVDGAGKVYLMFVVDVRITAVQAWDGAAWTQLVYKNGFPSPSIIAANPKYPAEFLYLGGRFNDFYSPAIINVVQVANNARWDGRRWLDLIAAGAAGEVFAIAADDQGFPGALYLGGSFTSVEGNPASNVARFDGTNWDVLGAGVNGPVHAIAPISFNQPGAFVGGAFSTAINPDGSTVSVSNIAFWDHNQKRWLPVGSGLNGAVYALEVSGYELYAGGAFTQSLNGTTVNRIARWSFSAQQWQALGSGVDGQFMPEVRALAVGLGGSVSSPRFWRSVYVGGRFTEATNSNGGKVFCRNLMLWDGYDNNWRAMGNGVDDEVRALALAGRDYYSPLYVGGRFRTGVDDNGALVNIDRVAMWYYGDWRPLGNGVNGAVTSIVPSYDHTQAYIGGEFTEAVNSNGVIKPANHIAVFERTYAAGVISEWDALGSGTNDVVNTIASVWPCPRSNKTEVLFVGGKFNLAGNKDARALAKWKYERPFSSRGHTTVIQGSSSRNRSGGGRSTRGTVATDGGYGPCNPGLGKNSQLADDLIFDNLGFRESAALPSLPYLEPFSLTLYDVEDINTPIAKFDSLVVSSENPQALILFGLNDTTAYAPNPEGYSIRESVLLQDLPILTNNANEVRAVFVHTVTDAPTVDLVTTSGNTLVSNLNYGAASQPISLAAGAYTVDLVRSSDKQKLSAHTFNVSNRNNGYIVIMLSGFLDPAANQNGPAAALGVYELKLTPTAVDERDEIAPASFALSQNYPNPFNPVTSMQFSVRASGGSPVQVSLKVYDVLGKEVAILVNEKKPAGIYRVSFDATGLASGVYLIRMNAGEFTQTRRLLLVR